MQTKDKTKSRDSDAVNISVPLIIFEEDGATICYCPSLDLSGYGLSETEAMTSYKYVLSEYIEYGTEHKTLAEDLKNLGWHFNKRIRKRIVPPSITKLLTHNENFKRVFEHFDYKKQSTSLQIPAF